MNFKSCCDKIRAVLTNNILVIYYTLLTLAIFYPLFAPGYILTLDTIWAADRNYVADHILNNGFGGQLPFLALLQFSEIFLPAWLTQKIILFLVFFISGWAAHTSVPSRSAIGKYFGGTLYAVNPFIYTRFLAGHLYLLLAYAFVPLAVRSFSDFLHDNTKWKQPLVWTTVIAIFDFHIFLLVLLMQLCIFLFVLAEIKHDRKIIFKNTLVFGFKFFLVNMFWILPVFVTTFSGSSVLNNISAPDLTAFTGQGTLSGNILISIAMMYGFWRGGYIYPFHLAPKWIFIGLFTIILFFAVYGFIVNTKKSMNKGLVVAAIISLVLASGVTYPSFAPIFNYLFEHLIIFKGMRDSQKFVAIIVFVYAVLGSLGVHELCSNISTNKRFTSLTKDKQRIFSFILAGIILAVPLLYSVTIFNGFSGQVTPKDYPPEWYEINDLLMNDTKDVDVLFFPWHMYMTFGWSERRIANPASIFLDKPVISGQNAEVGSIQTQSSNPTQYYMEYLLEHKNEITNFGELITPLNVKYIILAKELDYQKYDFLYNQTDLELLKENDKLVVFRNLHNTSRIRQVTSLKEIKTWNELVEESKIIDINDYGFVFVYDNADTIEQWKELSYTRKSAFTFQVPETGPYMIFTSPTHDQNGWVLNGNNGLDSVGLYSVFAQTKRSGADNTISFRPIIFHIIGCLISLIALLFIFYPFSKLKKHAK